MGRKRAIDPGGHGLLLVFFAAGGKRCPMFRDRVEQFYLRTRNSQCNDEFADFEYSFILSFEPCGCGT
jgi:hypothetical protein